MSGQPPSAGGEVEGGDDSASPPASNKPSGPVRIPLQRTPAQAKAAEERARKIAEKKALEDRSKQLAQIANLVIAGHSFESIGAAIGADANEVERLLNDNAARFVRTQPALRVWVRNWISEKYGTMIEVDWPIATDPSHEEKLDHQDRVMRMLDRMAKLHGANAPVQTEVKVEHTPEAVERLVQALSTRQGLGYDASVFDSVSDVVDAEVVHDAVTQGAEALEEASAAVEEPAEDDWSDEG